MQRKRRIIAANKKRDEAQQKDEIGGESSILNRENLSKLDEMTI